MNALLLLLAGLPQAATVTTDPGPPVPVSAREITEPEWERVKRPSSPLQYYPEAALSQRIEGKATMACAVTAKGDLRDCQVLSEAPPGLGFGESAVRMAVLFKMKPQTRDGLPVEGGVVRIPIRFRLPR